MQQGEPQYVEMPGVSGRYFTCEPYRATLAVSRCAAMFLEIARLKDGTTHPHARCAGCAIGALHAGVEPPKKRAIGRLTCARCHESATRLVCGGAICVSCYNREAEVRRGRNGKGVPPVPVDRFFSASAVGGRGKGKTVVLHDVSVLVEGAMRAMRAADTMEVMLRVLRNRPDAVFARSAQVARPHVGQLSLFAGL